MSAESFGGIEIHSTGDRLNMLDYNSLTKSHDEANALGWMLCTLMCSTDYSAYLIWRLMFQYEAASAFPIHCNCEFDGGAARHDRRCADPQLCDTSQRVA